MSHIYRYVLCLLLFVAGVTNVKAQQYPVTASTQIIPPYSVYLPDYAVAGSDKLRVILVQNDLTLPSYNVRLRITVEQNGTVIMRTATAFNPRPLSLSPGIPTIIGGIDLADYLNPANIEYSGGFSRTEYEKTRSLPEGAYRISFTAYDYSRPQVQVSNIGSNVFFFRKSDPPLLNLPICNSRVEKLDPQFLTFNWSSRNSPNPIPGSGTEYVFSLYEVRPAGSVPDYIVRSARPIYTLVTETNTIVYGPGEPQLRDSMQYVWTVQARDKSGRDMFSNQGLSQSCTFTYLGKNPFTQNNVPKPVLKGRSTGERSVRFSWPLAAANYQVEAYRLQYRATKMGDTEFDWQTEEKQLDTAFTASSLEPNRAYEGRLQWKIAGVYGPFSDLVTIKTDSAKTFVCGDASLLAALDNQTPQPSLSPAKIIRVGNFDIILTEVSGGNGKFTGKGRVITLGFGIGLQMEFKDITVNTDLKVIAGQVTAVTEGIDKFVSDKLDEQHGGNDVGGVVNGDLVPDITTKLKIFSPANIKVNTDDGSITLTDSNTGEQEVINYKDKGKTLPLVLEDADGNLYNIDKGGKVTSIGKRDSSITSAVLESLKTLQLDKGTVSFTPGTGNVYAFDAWKSGYSGKTNVEKEYESLASGKYHVSSKAIVPDEQEEVIATLTNAASGITASKLKFITGKGIVLTAKDNNNGSFTISLTGGPGGDAQEIYAAHPDGSGGYISLGKLLVPSYKPLQKKLVLVPIGAQTAVPTEQIKTALKDTYSKLGITYTVQVDESFRYNKTWDANGDSVLQDKGSAFLSNDFKGEEKALKKAYKKAINIDDNAVYLFVVNEAALSDGDLTGKMPRGSQFGFVFTKQASEAAIVRTVVHEIGHGDYTLEHTFSTNVGLGKSSTDNLMDYGSGYGLIKYQWDVLHDPGSVWGVFEDDDAGDNYFVKEISKDFINEDGKTVAFLTPAGTVLVVPYDSLGSVEFQYGAVKVADAKDQFDPEITVGCVRSFRLRDSGGIMRIYQYVDAEGVYKNGSSELYQQNVPDPAKVEGFIYPIQCADEYRLWKFYRTSFPLYKGGEPKLKFIELVERFNPFKDQLPVPNLKAGTSAFIQQDIKDAVYKTCVYCITPVTISMTEKHCWEEEYLWIDKIAQMRNVYPDYFEKFTQPEQVNLGTKYEPKIQAGNWEVPRTLTEHISSEDVRFSARDITVNDYDYPWGKYLKDHPEIKDAYGKNDILFFKTFYTEFTEYIKTAVTEDEDFWAKFDRGTPIKDLFTQLIDEPVFHLQSVPAEKRHLALKMMTERYNDRSLVGFQEKDLSYLRLFTSFRVDQQKALLVYIEDSLHVKRIYDLAMNDMTEESEIGVMMALSNMVTASGYCNYFKNYIHPDGQPVIMAQVEADLLRFKNATVEFTKSPVTITINGEDYRYNDIISVEVVGSFKIGDKTYEKGTILTMPAIQLALMSSMANSKVTENAAWLAFDVGTLVIGIGEAKVFFKAGNYIRKAIVAADIVGSTGGIALQLINTDVISPDLRAGLQIAFFVTSLPNMALSINKIDNLVTKLDKAIYKARLEQKAAKAVLDGLEGVSDKLSTAAHVGDAIDATELERRVVTIDGAADVNKVKSWLDNTKSLDDKNVYIVVHGDGKTFSVTHNGRDVELSHRSLSRYIRGLDDIGADRQLVLLSCADIETAQNLSRKLGAPVVANDGAVRVYSNGVIEADNGFVYIDEAGNIDDSKKIAVGKQEAPTGPMVQLGKAIARSGSVSELARNFGITTELATRLAANADFVAAYIKAEGAGTRFMRTLESSLEELSRTTDAGKAMAHHRTELLTVFADDPALFNAVYEQMSQVETILEGAAKIATPEAMKIGSIRHAINKMFEKTSLDIDFFYGLFNNVVAKHHIPLGSKERGIIKAARELTKIGEDRNVLVALVYRKGNPVPERLIAGSGKQDGVVNAIENMPWPKNRSFDQFRVGIDRVQDSESKFVEFFWNKRMGGKIDSDIEKVVFISERPVCPSCANAINIFKEKTQISNILIYEGKYMK
ncbi:fibronectin type III domain-containing protein [Chitinophaga sp. CF418]|uniref:fibronectin type III domain-containing protein n=1 Tax=Chitinophaga sp. CF418 TaxID=1855287 RepID=UPI00090FF908|nr:fibronectin type III domain-containing protein [Chitinophaga sp. CF418]SHN13358.1 hypothetical protein SAMN05216311_105384 [Chitinophaga sp. CF418]